MDMDMDMDMDPALWATLPKDLLDLVFVRFDVHEISRLRQLSKYWKRVLEEKAHPHMFGLISKDDDDYCCMVFDVESDQWHAFDVDALDDYCITTGAADVGLVCFVSDNTNLRLRIVVVNPLTNQKLILPRLIGMGRRLPTVQPTMMQLTMDRKTNHYKVFVTGYMESGGRRSFAQYYDSRIKEWTVVGAGEQSWDRVLGFEYQWDEDDKYYSGERLSPIVYDFEEQRLRYYGGDSIVQGPLVKNYALLKDRLFVLRKETRQRPPSLIHNDGEPRPFYCIWEYHLPKNATAWVQVQTHSCGPLDDCPEVDHRFLLHACHVFLMVLVQVGELLGGLVGSHVPHDKYDAGIFTTSLLPSGATFQFYQDNMKMSALWT